MNTNAIELSFESDELTNTDLEQVDGGRARLAILAAEFAGALIGTAAHRIYHWIAD